MWLYNCSTPRVTETVTALQGTRQIIQLVSTVPYFVDFSTPFVENLHSYLHEEQCLT